MPGILRPDTAAEVEFSWFKKHGTALRIKGAFGVSLHGSSDSTLTQFSMIAGYIVYSGSKGASDSWCLAMVLNLERAGDAIYLKHGWLQLSQTTIESGYIKVNQWRRYYIRTRLPRPSIPND